MVKRNTKPWGFFLLCAAAAAALFALNFALPANVVLKSGLSPFELAAIVAVLLALTALVDLAGRLRFQACKKLGWKTIPALVLAKPDGGLAGDASPTPAWPAG
jgi:hypothetical protein